MVDPIGVYIGEVVNQETYRLGSIMAKWWIYPDCINYKKVNSILIVFMYYY